MRGLFTCRTDFYIGSNQYFRKENLEWKAENIGWYQYFRLSIPSFLISFNIRSLLVSLDEAYQVLDGPAKCPLATLAPAYLLTSETLRVGKRHQSGYI